MPTRELKVEVGRILSFSIRAADTFNITTNNYEPINELPYNHAIFGNLVLYEIMVTESTPKEFVVGPDYMGVTWVITVGEVEKADSIVNRITFGSTLKKDIWIVFAIILLIILFVHMLNRGR